VDVMSEKIRFYKGLYKVKVVTESEGYWIVEALEDFEDCFESEGIKVKKGEQRIIPPDTLFEEKTMPPMIKEHEYELNMERKLKRIISEDDRKKNKV
jgi:hypothetical protein